MSFKTKFIDRKNLKLFSSGLSKFKWFLYGMQLNKKNKNIKNIDLYFYFSNFQMLTQIDTCLIMYIFSRTKCSEFY